MRLCEALSEIVADAAYNIYLIVFCRSRLKARIQATSGISRDLFFNVSSYCILSGKRQEDVEDARHQIDLIAHMELGESSGKDVDSLYTLPLSKVQLFLAEKSRIEALTHSTLLLSPDSEIDNIAKTRSARVRGTAVTVTDARRQLVLLCGAPIENIKKLYVVNERVRRAFLIW